VSCASVSYEILLNDYIPVIFTDCAAYGLGNVQGAVVRHGIGRSSTWLSTSHTRLLWTQKRWTIMSSLQSSRPMRGFTWVMAKDLS